MLEIKKNDEVYYRFKSFNDLVLSECFSYIERQALYKSLKDKKIIETPESIKGFILTESPAKPQ